MMRITSFPGFSSSLERELKCVKVVRTWMGRKVCLNTVKKDRLRAIALMKRKQILKALLEMVALTEVNPAKLFQNVFKVIQMELKSVQ